MTIKVSSANRVSFPFFGFGGLGLLAVAVAMLVGTALGYYTAGKLWASWLVGNNSNSNTSASASPERHRTDRKISYGNPAQEANL